MNNINNISTFEEELTKNGYIIYRNHGDSMAPLLKEGRDIIQINKIDRPLKRLDIVLFKRDDKYILHRIIRVHKKKNTYDIIGDNQYKIEKNVSKSNIIGILTKIIRNSTEFDPYSKKEMVRAHFISDFYIIRALILYIKHKLKRGNK